MNDDDIIKKQEDDDKKYTDEEMLKLVHYINKDWVDEFEKKEKRRFMSDVLFKIIIIVWIIGYWFISPSKIKVINTGNVDGSMNTENQIEYIEGDDR